MSTDNEHFVIFARPSFRSDRMQTSLAVRPSSILEKLVDAEGTLNERTDKALVRCHL